MKKPRLVALTIVTLDAMGVGLIMPVLPTLLRGFLPSTQVAGHYGILLALYALMQVFFAPLLGQLSDRHGRRPVLLISLAGAAVDYAVMAAAPVLWVLYVGRIISGVTGATGAVAASSIADTTPEDERVRWFGYMGACYGVGMIAGPAIGGSFGGISSHAPFMAAAILNGVGFLLACIFFGETQSAPGAAKMPIRYDLFGGFRLDGSLRALAALLAVFFIFQLIGQIPASLWVIYGEARFHWNITAVGVSLAGFGAVHALFQAFIAGPLSSRLGEKRTLLLGMTADGLGFMLMALATQSWMVFPILFLLAAGGVAMPALQAMLSKTVPGDRQGMLQGTLASLTNLSAIIGPLGFTMLYTVTAGIWSGWVWIVGAGLYVVCLPALRRPDREAGK